MVAVSGGRIILMSTPFGRRGHFYEAATGPEAWERVEVPATACPRIPAAFLAEERRAMPAWFYIQEYEAQFSDTDDQFFGSEWIERAADPTLEPLFGGDCDRGALLPGAGPGAGAGIQRYRHRCSCRSPGRCS